MKFTTNIVIITFTVIFILFIAGCDAEKADTSTDSTVTSVTISPATVYVAKGSTKTFSATVKGTNKPKQTVTWSITQTNKKVQHGNGYRYRRQHTSRSGKKYQYRF